MNEHWDRLKKVVAEDVEIWEELAATRESSAYRRNILNDRECRITAFHRTIDKLLEDPVSEDRSERQRVRSGAHLGDERSHEEQETQ